MADLGQFRAEGPSASPITPQQPVVDTSSLVATQTLGKIASVGFSLFSDSKKRDQAAAIESAKRDYSGQLVAITDAQAMGEIDQRTAQASIRKLLTHNLASGNLPADYLRSTTGEFLDLGQVVNKGTAQEQEQAKIRSAAVADGWVKPSMNPEETKTAINAYQDFTLAGNKLTRAKAQTDFDKTQRVNTQRVALSEMNVAYTQKFKGDINDTLAALSSGKLTGEQAVQELQAGWATIQSVVGSQGSEAGGEFLSNMTAPMKAMYESALKVADGTLGKTVYENQAAKNIAVARANITGDPETASIAAFTSMFQNSDLLLQKEINEQVIKFIGKNGDAAKRPVNLTDPDNRKDTEDYLSLFKDNVKSVLKGSAVDSEKTTIEAQTNLVQIVKGVGQYGASVDNPKELNAVFNTLADPATGRFLVQSGGVPADVAAEAKVVFTQAYRDPAIQAVLESFNNGQIKGISSTALGFDSISNNPVAASILPVFTGSGVTFVMDQSVKGVDQIAVRAKVKDLNKEAAPVLNRLIRLDAHLSGSTDYAKTYRDNYEESFLPPQTKAEPANKRPTAPNVPIDDSPILERSLPKEQYAKLEELKNQGFTRDQVERVMSFLDIKSDRGTGVDMYKAIDEVFNAKT
jgi:hypothetical protein